MAAMKDDPERLVSVAGCGTPTEADMLKLALEEHGIDSMIDGSELSTTLGHIGSAIGDVRILVRAGNATEAKAIIVATREAYVAPKEDPWFCGKCLEEVEGGFEICWSCGVLREEVEAPFPATATAIQHGEEHDIDTDSLGRETDNPYESPQALGTAENKPNEGANSRVAGVNWMMILALILVTALAVSLLRFWF